MGEGAFLQSMSQDSCNCVRHLLGWGQVCPVLRRRQKFIFLFLSFCNWVCDTNSVARGRFGTLGEITVLGIPGLLPCMGSIWGLESI
jgi:hypothetical protein